MTEATMSWLRPGEGAERSWAEAAYPNLIDFNRLPKSGRPAA
jgi:hypothetical protein